MFGLSSYRDHPALGTMIMMMMVNLQLGFISDVCSTFLYHCLFEYREFPTTQSIDDVFSAASPLLRFQRGKAETYDAHHYSSSTIDVRIRFLISFSNYQYLQMPSSDRMQRSQFKVPSSQGPLHIAHPFRSSDSHNACIAQIVRHQSSRSGTTPLIAHRVTARRCLQIV